MTDTEPRKAGTDIEALVVKLRDDDLVLSWQSTTKAMLEKAADALERQQAGGGGAGICKRQPL